MLAIIFEGSGTMRRWAWVRRVLALVITVVFVLGAAVSPALAAKGGGFSSGGSRSFSAPKVSAPSTPSRSFSSPKPSTPSKPSPTPSTPSRSFSTPSQSYSDPNSKSYSGSSRSYSSPGGSFSNQRPTGSTSSTPQPPPPTYDTSRTRYPSYPPVVIYGPSPFDPWYYHDVYWGHPWYWRMWHRPVYYGTSSGWGINWLPVLIGGGFGVWVLLAVVSSYTTRRRR